MSIFMCKKCGYVKETPNEYIGRTAKCPKCNSQSKVAEIAVFARELTIAYADIIKYKKEISTFGETIEKQKNQLITLDSKYHKQIDEKNVKIQNCHKELEALKESQKESSADIENITNDADFIPQENYQPIIDWFSKKITLIDIDESAVDTRGFFDEVAVSLGNNFTTLESVLEQIKYIQRKGYDTVKISLDKKSKEDIAIIKSFCQEIYDYSFASRYFYDRKKNAVYIEIQQATKIINFFNGMWMEWYVYVMLLEFFKKSEIEYSMARGIKIIHPNGQKNELDIFIMVDNIPICIECKSGEFRRDIGKYTKLQRQLGLTKEQFILCIIGDNIQIDGLTNTYDITFANQNTILKYIERIIRLSHENKERLLQIKMGYENIKEAETSKLEVEDISRPKKSFLGNLFSSTKKAK